MAVVVDSCVLLDIFTRDFQWYDWSSSALGAALDRGAVVLNPVVYAEVSVRFNRIEDFEMALASPAFEHRAIPREAAFLAGKSYRAYRRAGGEKSTPLPDFFIGAHAAVTGMALLTRDARRFRRYYPNVELICP